MIAVDALILFKIVTAMGSCSSPIDVALASGKDQSKIAHVIGCPAARSLGLELSGDVALPKIGRLHDVHIAVEDFESVLCHKLFPPVIAAKAAANHWQLSKILDDWTENYGFS